jgi:hypothetical protein
MKFGRCQSMQSNWNRFPLRILSGTPSSAVPVNLYHDESKSRIILKLLYIANLALFACSQFCSSLGAMLWSCSNFDPCAYMLEHCLVVRIIKVQPLDPRHEQSYDYIDVEVLPRSFPFPNFFEYT